MLVIDRDSIGDWNFCGQRHAAMMPVVLEKGMLMYGVSRFWQLDGRSWPDWCGKCSWQWLRNLVRAATTMDSWALSMAWTHVQAMDKAQESIVVAALTRFLSHCQVHFTAYVDNDSSCVSSAGRPFTQNIMGGARGGGGGGGTGGLDHPRKITLSNTGPEPLKNQASIQCRAIINLPAKRQINGISLAGRLVPWHF